MDTTVHLQGLNISSMRNCSFRF